ncbi:urease accessory protein UreE [Phyllobacterium phragmitis]|uniref:Urease accessory protein UreE n=1 Tax=Phyllobacterium phragmitis TaxID=2670329 RepID=A0A2S9IWG0_9HYPH|nr:urease accessory protein UreE [Phyllobacterium phragmitis]PRD44863.1 urease accessory protein UreE [Phyllobacterium phragmitis]
MILIEQVLGNVKDAVWKQRMDAARIDWLVLDQWEAQKNRLRKRTSKDLELAVALDRNTHLHDGDILVWDEAESSIVVVKTELKPVMVIDLEKVMAQSPELVLRTCFELGHALGNQHWPAVVKGNKVFVPLTIDQKVMSSVMRTHDFAGVTFEFMPGSDVIPYLAPHEARRLFGGAEPASHAHADHAPPHTHSHN